MCEGVYVLNYIYISKKYKNERFNHLMPEREF